ncbi:MAG: hypothetical protein Q7S87_08690 [Agitococcus sp.]|nr:hypothetical protein [Agitococcus sp.]MDO9176975.1 hypothetical protein [Agitococcus sp.]
MFSLIITIISIALVAALALATIFYGTKMYQDGRAQSNTVRAIQEGSQLSASMELYKADHGSLLVGTTAEIQSALVSQNYLKAWPTTGWEFQNDYAVQPNLSLEACTAINTKLGISSVPTCGDPAFVGKSFCCVAP